MPKFIDRSGYKYGRLTVLRFVGSSKLKTLWECVCDCGKTVTTTSGALATGNTSSCGCLLKDRTTKHGGSGKGSYNTWRAMLRRCTNPADKDYPRYGGMGVAVDPRWRDYLTFSADMGEPPTPKHSLDRIEPNGDYTPLNCRWATPQEQCRNIRAFGKMRGVRLRGKKWYAEIAVNKKKLYSCGFFTEEEAVAARSQLELLHWGENSHGV